MYIIHTSRYVQGRSEDVGESPKGLSGPTQASCEGGPWDGLHHGYQAGH